MTKEKAKKRPLRKRLIGKCGELQKEKDILEIKLSKMKKELEQEKYNSIYKFPF